MDDGHSPAAPEPLPVPPHLVLAGLATLHREELCNFLAIFDQLAAMKVASDSIRDFRDGLFRRSPQSERAFERRVQRAAAVRCRSECPDAHLRLLVWVALRDALGLPRLVPLATATADRRSAEVASRAARELGRSVRKELASADFSRWRKAVAKIGAIFSANQDADFGDVVRFEVARRIGERADELQPELPRGDCRFAPRSCGGPAQRASRRGIGGSHPNREPEDVEYDNCRYSVGRFRGYRGVGRLQRLHSGGESIRVDPVAWGEDGRLCVGCLG